MQDEQLNKLRDKLYDVQVPVEDGMWQAIEGSLRRRQLRKAVYYASSVAAILIISLTLFISNPQVSHTPLPDADLTPQSLEETSKLISEAITPQEEQVSQQVVDAQQVVMPQREVEHRQEAASYREIETQQEAAPQQNVAQEPAESAKSEKEVRKNYTLFNLNENEGYEAVVRSKKRMRSVSLMTNVMPGSSAAVANGIMMASSAGAQGISQSGVVEQVSDTKYSLPLNLGVQFQFDIAENVALGVGVNYTMLRSKYDCLINSKFHNVKQTLHYMGIPVNVYGLVVDKNNFNFYVNGGFLVEKGLRANYEISSYNSNVKENSSISGVLFSINAGLGVEYMLSNTVGLYFEPNLVYFFNSDVPRSIRTDQPLQVKAELGCRFHF